MGRSGRRAGQAVALASAAATVAAMQVRFARHTNRLDACVAFWRDRLGLPELTRFDEQVPAANPDSDRCGLRFADPDRFWVMLAARGWPD
jgi:hypothetical protein